MRVWACRGRQRVRNSPFTTACIKTDGRKERKELPTKEYAMQILEKFKTGRTHELTQEEVFLGVSYLDGTGRFQ